ncbi:MAG TPA: hypothetical protein ENH89_10865 [Aurantimonas coralicida]|uniref:Uncharacterized protein n=1 Tax=Aurantimonas coralicida TaxID=182270 RepID=A0A9C9NFX8_9HYPH|nr:hypothetical protein [Aurantimonas coralicida]
MQAEEIAAIERDYADKSTIGANHILHIAGTFDGDMPDDIGNTGLYYVLTTPMGTTRAYVERFRGNDDPVGHIERMFAAADRMTELMVIWLKAEFGDEKQFAQLARFLSTEFRHDVKNLAMYTWLASVQGASSESGEAFPADMVALALRIGLYLKDRQYATQDDLPTFAHFIFTDEESDRAQVQAGQLIAIAKGKAGITDPKFLQRLETFLSDRETMRRSAENVLRATPEYEQLMAQWENRPNDEKDNDKPDPWEIVEEMGRQLIHIEFDNPLLDDRLELTLQDVAEPAQTNGEWDRKSKTVSWSATLTDRPDKPNDVRAAIGQFSPVTGYEANTAKLPVLCYAIWEQPDVRFQIKHFGEVVLQDNDLWTYCLWYKSLTPARAKEWDALIDGLKPGEESLAKLEAFRFSDEASGEDAPTTYAETAISLITSAFAEKEADD